MPMGMAEAMLHGIWRAMVDYGASAPAMARWSLIDGLYIQSVCKCRMLAALAMVGRHAREKVWGKGLTRYLVRVLNDVMTYREDRTMTMYEVFDYRDGDTLHRTRTKMGARLYIWRHRWCTEHALDYARKGEGWL